MYMKYENENNKKQRPEPKQQLASPHGATLSWHTNHSKHTHSKHSHPDRIAVSALEWFSPAKPAMPPTCTSITNQTFLVRSRTEVAE
jgi:hypothetical protein